ERAPHPPVAADRPGFEERQTLPTLSARPVVLPVSGERSGQPAHGPFGPQPKIHPKYVPFLRDIGEHSRQIPRQVLKKLLIGNGTTLLGRRGSIVGLIDIDQIHVRAVVELSAAEFTHGNDREPALDQASGSPAMHWSAEAPLQISPGNLIGRLNQ